MLPKAIKFMQKKESYTIEAAQKDDFDIEKLKVAWSKQILKSLLNKF